MGGLTITNCSDFSMKDNIVVKKNENIFELLDAVGKEMQNIFSMDDVAWEHLQKLIDRVNEVKNIGQ